MIEEGSKFNFCTIYIGGWTCRVGMVTGLQNSYGMAQQNDTMEGPVTSFLLSFHIHTQYFSLPPLSTLPHSFLPSIAVQAKAMSDNTNVVGLGLFAYPVLQAADILLYK